MIKKGDVVDLIIKDMGYKGQSIGEIMDSTDSKFTVFADKDLAQIRRSHLSHHYGLHRRASVGPG